MSIVATDSPRCHIAIQDKYFVKVPRDKITGDSKFYLQPLPYTPTGSMPWFFPDPYSGRKLESLLKVMCQGAGIEGHFTNHSLRATTLFDTGVPESVIQKHTGHKSLDALRTYMHKHIFNSCPGGHSFSNSHPNLSTDIHVCNRVLLMISSLKAFHMKLTTFDLA